MKQSKTKEIFEHCHVTQYIIMRGIDVDFTLYSVFIIVPDDAVATHDT